MEKMGRSARLPANRAPLTPESSLLDTRRGPSGRDTFGGRALAWFSRFVDAATRWRACREFWRKRLAGRVKSSGWADSRWRRAALPQKSSSALSITNTATCSSGRRHLAPLAWALTFAIAALATATPALGDGPRGTFGGAAAGAAKARAAGQPRPAPRAPTGQVRIESATADQREREVAVAHAPRR
jgi:hypothetical protein